MLCCIMASPTTVYTHGHHESVLRSHNWRTAANSAGYLLPSIQPTMKILDVGCGPGTITIDLAQLVPHGHVTGLEAEAEVLKQARETAAARSVPNIDFAVGNVLALDYPDDTFDVVHAHQVLQHVGDPVRALREMRRVTRPGGTVAARENDHSATFWYPELKGLTKWQRQYLRVCHANGGEPDAGRRLHVWAREAGFDRTSMTLTASTWCHSTPQERAWWGGLWADRTLGSRYADIAIQGGAATREELESSAKAWREWAEDEDGWIVLVHGEILCRVRDKEPWPLS